jgi:hypothetical protein
MMKKNLKRKELLHIATRLYTLFAKSIVKNDIDYQLTIKIVETFFRWHTCEGLHGLKRAKTMSNCFVRHLMGTPLVSVPLSNRYKRLIHKALLNCSCNKSRIYWVSVFSLVRLLHTEPVVDVSTITSRFKGNLLQLLSFDYLRAWKQVNQSFRSVVPAHQNWRVTFKWHISGASGPNGSLGYTRYLDDLRSLSNDWLLVGLFILLYSLPFDNKRETVKALRDAFFDSIRKGDKNSIHSRLAFLSEKGGKTRVVALVDILSQSLLNTVHQRCNVILRRIRQDGTFDQDRSRRFIKKMSEVKTNPLASIDLTAATDRMPALYQVLVLVSLRILSPLQAFGWWWVSTRRTFVYKNGDVLERTRYVVGQPMGSLSSWPVMAISHHFLVRLSFAVSGHKRLEKASYSVLGDDLTLLGHDVAGEYLKIIKYLGMEFSEEKTYITLGAAEFAKSLFRHGEDLTPFPVSLLVFNRNTIVSNTLAIITDCDRINLPITSATLTGLFPSRWRKLVLLASLSPLSPRSVLDLPSRKDPWIFQQFIYCKRIRYFGRLNTVRKCTHAFAINDPGTSGKTLASPFLQIAKENERSFPLRHLKEDTHLLVLLGQNWISYSTESWPDGLPPLGDRTLIPGPVWEKSRDDLMSRSALLELDKLMPNYFTVRCVGKQVGE